MEDACSWIRITKFSHRFDSRLTPVPFQEVQRNSCMSSPIGRSPLVNEERSLSHTPENKLTDVFKEAQTDTKRSSTPPHPRRIQSDDQGIMGKLFQKSPQPNSSHLSHSASNSDKPSKSKRKEAKNFEHGGGSSVNAVDELGLDLSNVFLGPKFAHGAHSTIYHGKYNEEAVAIKMIKVPEDDEGGVLAASLEKQFNREPRTEYLDEGSSRLYLKKLEGKSLPLEKLIAMALDIARGMEYIHSQGVIHRDLKPENVLIDKDFRLKIADFDQGRS
ncbi:hypothetical protein ACLB2K_064832 [Fragaria x ananassa]